MGIGSGNPVGKGKLGAGVTGASARRGAHTSDPQVAGLLEGLRRAAELRLSDAPTEAALAAQRTRDLEALLLSTTTGLRDLFKTRSPDDVFELFFPQPFAGLAGDTGSSPALRVEQVYFFRDACEVGLETSSEGDSTAERFEALYSKAIAQGSALSDQEELGERTPLQVARDLVLEAATLGRHSDREALKGELKRALSTLIRFEFPDADLRHAVALDTDRAALGEAYRLAEEVCVSLREDLRRRAQTDPLDMLIRELRSALA